MVRYLNKKTVSVFCLMVCLFLAFLLFGLFVPVRLTIIDIPTPFYADIQLCSDNVSVQYVSLFGVKRPATDVYGTQNTDGTVQIWSKYLSYVHQYDVMTPKQINVTYDDDDGVYVGQSVDASKIHVSATYDDGVRDVEWFEVSDDIIPLSSNVTIPVKTMCGMTDVTLKVIQPKDVKAVYQADCQMGDMFDRNNVVVSLVYPDDTEFQIDDFIIPDALTYLSDDNVVTVVTDYGNASLHIVPNNATRLEVSYDKDVYVGDKLDVSHVQLKIGDMIVPTSEITLEDAGVIKTQTDVLVTSKYGTVVLSIDPIKVQSCKLVVQQSVVGDVLPSINSVYIRFTDGTVRDVAVDECEFMNLDYGLQVGVSDVWFIYKTLRLYATVFVAPDNIALLRSNDVNIPEDVSTYDLTDEQVQNIAIVCQRLAGDDLSWVAAEVSLMANRYELYGSDVDLWSYVVNSGYWGTDIEDYIVDRIANQDVTYVVRDVLVNGYRYLPLYVDDRCDFSFEDVCQVGDIIQDENGNLYMFYLGASGSSSIMYCSTEYAYQYYTGNVFDDDSVIHTTSRNVDDVNIDI